MPEPILQAEHVSHAYGQRQALADVSLSVERGEIFGFLGPNGSGKTTLFRLLSTLMPLQAGTVRIAGADLASQRDAVRRLIAVVFQSPSLDVHLTVEENLRHHGHLYGLRGEELAARMGRMLERFGLQDRRRDYARTLSGGMRRRVELAKGLLTDPAVLLLDEPSTGLDPAARIDLWEALDDARSQGVTILATTHLIEEGERCGRLAVMDRGRIAACGTPAQLKEKVGGDVITVSGPDPAALRGAIAERFAIEAEPIGDVLRLERPRAHEFVPQLVEKLPGLINAISVGKPTLEDVFIHVTGRGLGDEGNG